MATAEQEVIVSIHGIDIKRNALYKIEPKLDKEAPNGFIEKGTTKLPSEDISNSITCRFTEDRYDTGLYPFSPCYNGWDEERKLAVLSNLEKYIVKPFEQLKGKVGILEQGNYEFWDNYNVDLQEGRVFNTNNITDLLDLYIALMSYNLAPVSKAGAPEFQTADYIIVDATQSMSVKSKRNADKKDAMYGFASLEVKEKDTLINILKYLNIIRIHIVPTEREMTDAFFLWLDKDVQNPQSFNRIYEESKTERGKEKIMLKVKLDSMIASRKISKDGSELMYKGIPLGVDVKAAMHNLTNDEELKDIYSEIIMS